MTETTNEQLYLEFNNVESKLLLCPCCKSKYEQPVCLPCHDVVCFKCLKDLKTETYDHGEFVKCPECNGEHKRQPDADYKPSRFILKALEFEPIKVTRGAEFEKKLKSAFNMCNILMDSINLSNDLLASAEANITDQCSEMKTKIDLFVEIRIDELNKHRDEFFARIDTYQKECLDDFHGNLKPYFDTNSTLLSSTNEWLHTLVESSCLEEQAKHIEAVASEKQAELTKKID
jgi:uncharacterized C2H2 Zn-finger protein